MIIKKSLKTVMPSLKRCRVSDSGADEDDFSGNNNRKKRKSSGGYYPLHLLGEVAAGIIPFNGYRIQTILAAGGDGGAAAAAAASWCTEVSRCAVEAEMNSAPKQRSNPVNEASRPPLVRTSRGRVQVLPSRFNDSVLDNWKKETQKQKKLGKSLTEALKLVLLIGLVVMAFGPSYSYSLIRLLYGRKWSDGEASTALRYYCLYVILLAMNGTSEAFLHAVANEIQLKRSNDSLLVFSLIYLVLNVSLIHSAGAIGLILANSLNMALRITYSAVFIRNYFQDSSSFSFRRCLPSGWTFLLFSGIVTLVSEKIFLDPDDFWRTFSIHFLVGITSFMLAAFIIYRRERTFINNIIRFREHAD